MRFHYSVSVSLNIQTHTWQYQLNFRQISCHHFSGLLPPLVSSLANTPQPTADKGLTNVGQYGIVYGNSPKSLFMHLSKVLPVSPNSRHHQHI